MLAKRLASILPDISFEEALEVTKIHSITGLLSEENPLILKNYVLLNSCLFSPFAWLHIFSFYATTDGTPCAPSVLINFSDFIYDLLQFP